MKKTKSYLAGYQFGVRESDIHEFAHCAQHLAHVATAGGWLADEFAEGYKTAYYHWLEVAVDADESTVA